MGSYFTNECNVSTENEVIKILITDLQEQCYINDSIMDEFKTCHPKQIISTEIPIPIWRIKYSYYTQRGNPKTANKYLLRDESEWEVVDVEFNNYIKSYNEKNPERQLSNVKILDIEFIGKVYLELE